MAPSVAKWTEEGWDLNPTEHFCAGCGEPLAFAEEVFLLKIVQAQLIEGRIEYYDVLNDTGDFMWDPYFFEFFCWEGVQEDLTNHFDDVPPVSDPHNSLLECDTCSNDINPWEIFGLVAFGELHCAKRTPNNKPTTIFEDMHDYKHICISCLFILNEVNSCWQQTLIPLPDYDACEEGIYSKCWRGHCPCRLTVNH